MLIVAVKFQRQQWQGGYAHKDQHQPCILAGEISKFVTLVLLVSTVYQPNTGAAPTCQWTRSPTREGSAVQLNSTNPPSVPDAVKTFRTGLWAPEQSVVVVVSHRNRCYR